MGKVFAIRSNRGAKKSKFSKEVKRCFRAVNKLQERKGHNENKAS